MRIRLLLVLALLAVTLAAPAHARPDPLPSWNDGAAKGRIVAFVKAVTEPGGKDFVAPADRIAVFDNDGTLWSEQPMYFQLAFALDRVKALAPQHPEWKTTQPFKAAIEGDMKALAASGEHGLVELLMASHAGNTSEEFAAIVRDWAKSARHPKLARPYTELTYQPMRELLAYLRANGFKTYIVSGGGVEFLRVMAEELYGVPPEQVIGSVDQDEVRGARRHAGASCGCPRSISSTTRPASRWRSTSTSADGRSPRSATPTATSRCWNDTTYGTGARLGLIVHHDDAKREFAYDRASPIGKLDRGWTRPASGAGSSSA